MAIKYLGRDLQKRIINGREVQKVMYNGVQIRPEQAPTYERGVFWERNLGIISITGDGTHWITISDKNEGATVPYIPGDALSESNCGKFYQWGNNYGFPFFGNINYDTQRVDTSNYSWQNPYSSSTFIYVYYDWSDPSNDNLWGDVTDTLIARKGPCANGFHIPTGDDWAYLEGIISQFYTSGQISETYPRFLRDALLLPAAGCRTPQPRAVGDNCYYFCSSCADHGEQYTNTYSLQVIQNSFVDLTSFDWKSNGESIRAFKNTPVVPGQDPTQNWIVLYQPSS